MHPKYQEVIDYITNNYLKDSSGNGEIPSEPDLARLLGISRYPVNRAYNILASKGTLVKIGGIGTFVHGREPEKFRQKKIKISRAAGLAYFNTPDFDITGTLQELLIPAGYITVDVLSGNAANDNTAFLQRLSISGIESVFIIPRIFFGHGDAPELSLIKLLKDNGITTILLERGLEKYHGPQVIIDNAGGTASAVEYMLCSGRKKIAYIGKDDYLVGKERFNGYLNALDRAGIKRNDSLIYLDRGGAQFVNDLDKFIRAVEESILKNTPDCNSFVCFSSLFAYKLYSRLKDTGHLKDEMIFAGYERPQTPDMDFEKRFIFLERPMKEVAKAGAEILTDLMNSDEKNPPVIKRVMPHMYLPSNRTKTLAETGL